MKDFRELKVWEKAHELALASYKISARFPNEERFGLTTQIRRCGSSVPANIAEGCGRSGDGEFHRFLQTAMGSLTELDYHWLLARDLGFIKKEEYAPLHEDVLEVKRMLSALIRKVQLDRAR